MILAGCAVGPNYKQPENNVSNTWAMAAPETTSDAPLVEWWKVLMTSC